MSSEKSTLNRILCPTINTDRPFGHCPQFWKKEKKKEKKTASEVAVTHSAEIKSYCTCLLLL